jgi:hypothetical protein
MRQRRREAHDDDDEWPEGAEHATGGYGEDDDFDYEEYVEREFPGDATGRRRGGWKQWIWRAVVVVVCLLLIWRFLLY